ncbi:pyridoxamine 5'-phosphate oxidase family protein [Streptomyces sp. AV19]|nr:pyridoxamine 5'-phosphate oxidase family protein [Streptomyces sp. AV19]
MEALVCHVAYCDTKATPAEPHSVPMTYGYDGSTLYLHGNPRSHLQRLAHESGEVGVPVCLSIALVDRLVLARSAFQHGINYRSVVIRSTAIAVTGEDLCNGLRTVVEHVIPGRWNDSRKPDSDDLKHTGLLRVDLGKSAEITAKCRADGPTDKDKDISKPYWAGVLHIQQIYGPPCPAQNLKPGIAVPAYLKNYTRIHNT